MEKKKTENFDEDFEKALRSYGYNFPITEDEIKKFEKLIEPEIIPPFNFQTNPIEIVKKGITSKVKITTHLSVDHKSAENLARAAREGKGVSESVRKKMEDDRKNSDND